MTYSIDYSAATALYKTMPEAAYRMLQLEILQGLHRPGSAIKQDEVAQRLGVSKIPLREALTRLESEGSIVLKPRRGYFVAEYSINEIHEIFELRATMEDMVGRIAAVERSEQDVAQVIALVQSMEALQVDSPQYHHDWYELNRQFHDAIINASGKKHLIRIVTQLRYIIEPYVRLDASTSVAEKRVNSEHRLMATAFEQRDAKWLGTLSAAHCYHTRDRLVAAMKEKLRAV